MQKILFVFFIICFSFSSGARENKGPVFENEDLEHQDEDLLRKVKNLKIRTLSDLAQLSDFEDVAILQRRFMPKTGRLSVSALSTFILSSAFFLNPGAEGHLTYHFLEKHSMELSGYYVGVFDRGVTDDLSKMGITVTEEFSLATVFVGLTYKWMPSYGKISLYNRRILSFDTFFNIGGGMSGIARGSGKAPMVWEPTTVIGIGQVFAITRDLGLRWDLRWHLTVQTRKNFSTLDNILFSIGLSYYYPSAGAR